MDVRVLAPPIRRKISSGVQFLGIYARIFRDRLAGGPILLNYSVTGRCNSSCCMCGMWRNQGGEMSLEDSRKVFRHPYFKKVKYVGLSGGEITLLPDLRQRVEVICDNLPSLKGFSVIVNCVDSDLTKKHLTALRDVAGERGLSFFIELSLDGVGKVHDINRGVDGNFKAVTKVADFLKGGDTPFRFDCTVTKNNCRHLDSVLDFAVGLGVPVKFRIATHIKRLHNQDCAAIGGFSDKEKYLLEVFFKKLISTYEKNLLLNDTYQNIVEMVVNEGSRIVGCPYQINSVYVDPQGGVYCCAPSGEAVGETMELDAGSIKYLIEGERDRVSGSSCSSCIHDYHGPMRFDRRWGYFRQNLSDFYYRWLFGIGNSIRRYGKIKKSIQIQATAGEGDVLITGWYGTETIGDKAILAEIIRRRRIENPKAGICVSSIYPYVTNYTLRELGLEDVRVIPTYSGEFLKACRSASEIVVGGGPLMHLEELGLILTAFCVGHNGGSKLTVEGCGIGPLNKPGRYGQAIKAILDLASEVKVRDSQSKKWILENTQRDDVSVVEDPSVAFVKRFMHSTKGGGAKKQVSFFLREWPRDYAAIPEDEYMRIRWLFDRDVGGLIESLMASGYDIRLLPMHHFHIGGDDRRYYNHLVNSYVKDERFRGELVYGLNQIVSPEEVISQMMMSELNVCMRFHSNVFAYVVGNPFIGIDYTGGGKVKCFFEDYGVLDPMVSLHDYSEGDLIKCAKDVLGGGLG